MAVHNDKEILKDKGTGSAIFTTDMGTGKQGEIGTRSDNNTSDRVQSAGAPGSAGMVGSKKWLEAHTDQYGNIKSNEL